MKHLPDYANEVIGEHLNVIDSVLPGFLEAYYIYGSVSLGEFNRGISDIDFIAIITRKATEADLDMLKKIHRIMKRKFKKAILDGMYLLKYDFETLIKGEITCLRFNEGVFKGYEIFDTNSVDAYELKQYGVAVRGRDINEIVYIVDFDILVNRMKENLNTYWFQWVNSYKRFPSFRYISLLISLKTIEWSVLGVSRLYYTFKERDIISKVGAGEYVLDSVPERWHKVIKEAMRLRKNNKKSFYNSTFIRRSDALNYMEYIIQECNKLFLT